MTIDHVVELLDSEALLGFLAGKGIDVSRPIWAVDVVDETRAMLTLRARSASHDLIVRRPTHGRQGASAQDVFREYKILTAVRAAGLPVPRTLAASVDSGIVGTPFIVSEYVDGVPMRTADDLYGLPNEAIVSAVSNLVEVLASLHGIDVVAAGLSDLDRTKDHMVREVDRCRRAWEQVGNREHPLVVALARRLSTIAPAASRRSIVHGDFWVGTAILDRLTSSRVKAIRGWDDCGIGDPLSDLASMCAYHHPAINTMLGQRAASTSPRMPATEQVLTAYAAASGRSIEHWPFHLALAYFKLAVRAQERALDNPGDLDRRGLDGPPDPVLMLLDTAFSTAHDSS